MTPEEARDSHGGPSALPVELRRRYRLYLLPLVLCPVVLMVTACVVVPSRWLELRARNIYLANLGYGATLHGADCEIVVAGDSSAMVGVDPAELRERTGMSACNVAEFEGMTILNGTMVLDRYLAQNARPRFLVFAYTPEDFDPQSQRHEIGLFEAITWRMRQPGRLLSVAELLRHPEEFFVWVEQGLRLTVERSLNRPAPVEILEYRAKRGGQLPSDAPAPAECESAGRPHSEPDRAWVDGLRAKYGVGGTTVLMDATPMPPCDEQLAYFEQRLPGVIDNRVETFPLDAYTTDGRLHMNAAGAARFSEQIAEQILEPRVKGER